jgi:hypothetical protein
MNDQFVTPTKQERKNIYIDPFETPKNQVIPREPTAPVKPNGQPVITYHVVQLFPQIPGHNQTPLPSVIQNPNQNQNATTGTNLNNNLNGGKRRKHKKKNKNKKTQIQTRYTTTTLSRSVFRQKRG